MFNCARVKVQKALNRIKVHAKTYKLNKKKVLLKLKLSPINADSTQKINQPQILKFSSL